MAGIGGADGRTAEKLGYLGLGMMGFPMTRRLLNAGHDVTVWNRSPGKAAALVEAGAKPAGTSARSGRCRQHHLHVPHRCRGRGRSGVRPRRSGDGGWRRKARRRLLLDPPGCGARHRGAAEAGERHGMDRCAGFRRHHGRRGRHARGDGRRRCRRYRAGAALCSGDGATAHPYGSDRRGPDHQALQPGHRRLRHGGARGGDAACRERRDRRQAAAGSAGRRFCRFHSACNCSCRAWCRAFIRRRSAISPRC